LMDYEGTLIVVSHDRRFLDNVVDRILVFEEDAGVQEYVGGYSDWVKRGRELKISEQEGLRVRNAKTTIPLPLQSAPAEVKKPAKLSYRLQRELEALPKQIEELEAAKALLEEQIAAPDFYSQPYELTEPVLQALNDKHWEINRAMERWIELQEMA